MNHKTKTQDPRTDKTFYSFRKAKWGNITFFSVATLFAVIALPIYIMHWGLSASLIPLFIFYFFATSLSITMGYHRLFSHATFKAHGIVRFLALFFGSASFQQSALTWSSQHRDHHRFVDTDRDPYSIKKGFLYAHLGWMILWEHPLHFENAKDLQKSKLLMHQHRHYVLWSVASGIILPTLIGALLGHMVGAFLFCVCARLMIVYNTTWCINSVCHMFGKSTYDIHSTAKDHWFAAILTNGEGYHNYHHHFPWDYRNGVRWYHWDPTKWIIATLALFGLAKDLKRVSVFRVMEARLVAEKQRVDEKMLIKLRNTIDVNFQKVFHEQYENLKHTLSEWEHAAREYQVILSKRLAQHSEIKKQAALKSIEARREFQEVLAQWKTIYTQLLAA